MMWLIGSAWACMCISTRLPADLEPMAHVFQGRVVGTEPVDNPSSGFPQTRYLLEVRNDWRGVESERASVRVDSGVTSDGKFAMSSCSASLLVGQEILVAAADVDPMVNKCGGFLMVAPGQDLAWLGQQVKSFDLQPGPADAFAAAAARCDVDGLRRGRDTGLAIPIKALARCGADAIEVLMVDRSGFGMPVRDLPHLVVEESSSETVRELVRRHPQTARHVVQRATQSGRIDVLFQLSDLGLVSMSLSQLPAHPELFRRRLGVDAMSPLAVNQTLRACFVEAPGLTRAERHEAARVFLSSDPGLANDEWGADLNVRLAAADGFPTSEVLDLVSKGPVDKRSEWAFAGMRGAAESGRADLFIALWDRHPVKSTRRVQSLRSGACGGGSEMVDAVLEASGGSLDDLGCGCLAKAVNGDHVAVLERLAKQADGECRAKMWAASFKNGSIEAARWMASRGASPMSTELLQDAIRSRSPEVVALALELGADANGKVRERTMLELVVDMDGAPPGMKVRMVEVLLEAGADAGMVPELVLRHVRSGSEAAVRRILETR